MDFSPLDAFSNLLETYRVMGSSTEGVLDDLAFLKAVLMDPPQQFIEESQSVADLIISSFDLERMDETMVPQLRKSLANPLRRLWLLTNNVRTSYNDRSKQLKPLRDDFPTTGQLGFVDHLVEYLEELLKVKADSIGPLKPYFFRLQQKLKFLSSHLMKIPELRREEADLKDLIRRISNLAYEVEYAVDLFLVRDIAIWYCMFWLRDILTEVKHKKRLIMIDSGDKRSIIKCILPKVPVKFNIIPIVNSTEISMKLVEVFNTYAIIVKFSVRTRSLVSSYDERKKEVFHQLLDNVSYPNDFRGLLQETCTSHIREDELKNSVHELLKNKKYFIILEDVWDIDAFNDVRSVLPNGHNGSTILLTTPSPELVVQCRYGSQKHFPNKVSENYTSTSRTNKPTTVDDVVGFKEEIEGMLDLLLTGSSKLQIISIFGMPGLGKTTLAKKMYGDPRIFEYFDICAWCCISQIYTQRGLLLELLSQVNQDSDTIQHENDHELAALLWKNLVGRRFLVVLDDMWSIGAWNDLKRCFPTENNGSRIIFTTRLKGLASQAQYGSKLQPLCPLSDDESWALLEKKLFPKESCPLELSVVGRQIAKNCAGLPLLVVLTAGLLVKTVKNVDQWKQIAETLSSRILDEEAQGKGIIELSYKHLPNDLKPCFLYFGAFLEDREVPVRKLIRLWIAEGFIKHTKLKSLEDVAKDYLKDLIERSLVIVAREKSNGGVKTCRMHDLLREFCLIKAREENFLQLTRGYDELFPSFDDNVDYGRDPNYSDSSISTKYHPRRLCIYSKRNHFIMLKPFGRFVRSLLLFTTSDMRPTYSYDSSFISHNFKILKILDLEDLNIENPFGEIDVLVHLKYLAVQGTMVSIPSTIANLWNLETFSVKSSEDKVVRVPDSIWDMTKLRHVHISNRASFDLEPHRLENSSILENLQTFSTPSFVNGDDMEKILRRLPGIQKLKCIFSDSWDDTRNCNQFPALGGVSQLVSLNVLYNGKGMYPCKFEFPSNLRKLTLSNFRMPWSEISQLAILCNLEVLKLLGAFEGEIWEMHDKVFQKLKFLKLDTLDVVSWSASGDNFPCLTHLVLNKCARLQEIPLGIGDISTLEMIEVMWCNRRVATSVQPIQEEQLNFGNEGLKIHIHPKLWNLESSS